MAVDVFGELARATSLGGVGGGLHSANVIGGEDLSV